MVDGISLYIWVERLKPYTAIGISMVMSSIQVLLLSLVEVLDISLVPFTFSFGGFSYDTWAITSTVRGETRYKGGLPILLIHLLIALIFLKLREFIYFSLFLCWITIPIALFITYILPVIQEKCEREKEVRT